MKNIKSVIVFQSEMNGALAFSAAGRGMWTVPSSDATKGVRFAAKSATAVHPTAWPARNPAAIACALERADAIGHGCWGGR